METIESFDTVHEIDGFNVVATIEPDQDRGAPWLEDDGHGPVSEWTRRDKRAGELVLSTDGRNSAKRFYDYAEACKIARRDGWGYLPGKLQYHSNSAGKWTAWVGSHCGSYAEYVEAGHDDANDAIRAVYAAVRASMSPREYAARAALADYERLRKWCAGLWGYCGVIVSVSRADVNIGSASVWGIEDDAGDYLLESANECLTDALDDARARIRQLVA